MPQICDNLITGNFGSNLITFKLSKYCLIRPVLEGTDIGIDLYCESFDEKGRPFLHFWVQVKTGGKSISISEDKSIASYSFECSHLRYWDRQPVPVFAFLVPTNNLLSEKNYDFYIVDITFQIITESTVRRKINKQKTIKLKSNFNIKNEDDLKKFIYERVPYTTSIQRLKKGIITSIPSIETKYEISVPSGISQDYTYEILERIRKTSSIAIQDIVDVEQEFPRLRDDRKKLAKILKVFEKRRKWEIPFSLGLSSFMDEENIKAKEYFKKSLKVIEDDKKIDQNKWEPTKKILRDYLLKVEQKIKKQEIEIYTSSGVFLKENLRHLFVVTTSGNKNNKIK